MKILIGITGSISAYKILDLMRKLKKEENEIKVILSAPAKNFISTLNIKSFGIEYYTDPFDDSVEQPIHVSLAKWADVLLISPATMNTVSKMALGICDNLLLSTYFVFNKKVMIAPAMNTNMYSNPAFQKNLHVLKEQGVIEIPPKSGSLANYDKGIGVLEDIDIIFEELRNIDHYNDKFKDKNVLITAGGSSEDIDPIRIISNKSTGTMGRELALAFYRSGANVKIISSVPMELPSKIEVISANTVDDFLRDSEKRQEWFDIYVSSAALSDFIPKSQTQKIKKENFDYQIKFDKAPEVLTNIIKNKKKKQFIIGFAAETKIDLEKIMKKFEQKRPDLIVVNKISHINGFGAKKVNGYILYKGKKIIIKSMNKKNFALKLLENIDE